LGKAKIKDGTLLAMLIKKYRHFWKIEVKVETYWSHLYPDVFIGCMKIKISKKNLQPTGNKDLLGLLVAVCPHVPGLFCPLP
jgi:hypothetical protein